IIRTKRNQKIHQNLEDFVHSINTVKTKNKKIASKNSGTNKVNLSENRHDKKDNEEYRFDSKKVEDECSKVMREGGEEVNESEGLKDCLDKEDNYNSGVVNTNSGDCVEAVNEVDIVNSSGLDNKLVNVPTEVSESGNDVIIFDDEIIELGSKKLGLRDVIAKNGVFYFKFQDVEGIKEMINNGPWMVNNKPMVVQKWSIDMCLDKAEPKKIPVWYWKHVIMDEVTTKMCVTGVGRIGFTRVLVEIDAEKRIKEEIEIMYKSKNVAKETKKIMDVEYSWTPCICSHCKVFGHTHSYCKVC
ncbi:ATPase, F1/V1/A1 complex, alpha/beta subunit, partial [Tanacetum coccineum]